MRLWKWPRDRYRSPIDFIYHPLHCRYIFTSIRAMIQVSGRGGRRSRFPDSRGMTGSISLEGSEYELSELFECLTETRSVIKQRLSFDKIDPFTTTNYPHTVPEKQERKERVKGRGERERKEGRSERAGER